MFIKNLFHLVRHELKLEMKQKHFLSSIVLYIVSTIFVCSLSFTSIEDTKIWNALFWIIILFSLTNAISKSFLNENSDKQLFLYTLLNPRVLILGKILYNLVLSVFLVLLSFFIFNFFIQSDGLKNINFSLFLLAVVLGSMSISSTLTMVSAIASKTNNNIGILSILAFPILIPSLLLSIQFSNLAINGGTAEMASQFIVFLSLINLLIIILSFLLFPYLWRE
ncbi:heme exporter protein CcmB [Flavobacteriales bacterium]|jgi:heme exporter protein B|nr:heme exporter protein CcmB [Flavobacteriales bacterium]MDC0015097.1 heme exporter protein CcmB [Flavobacteriales bacterium]MDC1370980.1 heme exporter protein CcmB [Flavobacteriales bacterium]MDG1175578.1 heme exporter protein CcmB [Flavobacteriales bacterium]